MEPSAEKPHPNADVGAREAEHGMAVRRMFDRIAPTYDLLNRVLSAGTDRRWRKEAIEFLTRAPEGPFLDLCAGTMDLTAMLSHRFPQRHLVALDFASEMLDRGRAKAPRADVLVGDAHALPLDAGSIAGVVCGFGMRNLVDPGQGIREVFRVLKPRGTFVTLEFFQPLRKTTRLFHQAYASHVLPAIGGFLSGDRSAYAYLSESMNRYWPRSRYEAELRNAGFSDVMHVDLTLGIASIVVAEKPW